MSKSNQLLLSMTSSRSIRCIYWILVKNKARKFSKAFIKSLCFVLQKEYARFYIFIEFLSKNYNHNQQVDLNEVVIYVSKSPCFHQDCDPKCEVVDECRCNKACAKLLGLLLSKIRKELSKVDVRMTVKFLYPHLNRGDLYTKQGILCMLQAGIKVFLKLLKIFYIYLQKKNILILRLNQSFLCKHHAKIY